MSLIDNLRKFINIIDKLRDIGLEKHIQLPRIVVLGSQSSGKSSLLESIVGIDFLPRGDGLVTRRPLEMRLINVSIDQAPTPYAIFEEIKNQKFSDFDVVRDKIVWLTDQVSGSRKNIVNIPIILTIYSSTCPDLTLVDLPGITRIPLHGSEQPDNIEEVTKNMALHYVKEPRTIILAVIPANSDLSTSDALKMAKEIDPQGKRTLGVLTKIDIMDRGTSAKRILMNQEIQLSMGYVGVKLRSQQDIIDKQPVKISLANEKNYFATHSIYSTLPQGSLGIESLTVKLTQLLYSHIRQHLPQIVGEINVKVKEIENELFNMGPSLPVTEQEKFQLVFELIQEFSKSFQNSISGKFQMKNKGDDLPEGAKFREEFNRLYDEFLNFQSKNEYSDFEIKKQILLHEGDQLPGFQSMDAFYYLLQPQLQKLQDPALDCLDIVHKYLENLTTKLLQNHCNRFPVLYQDLEEKILRMLQDQKDKTYKIIQNTLDYETGYLFTNNSQDFNSFISTKIHIQVQSDQNIDPKQQLIVELRNKMDKYFHITLKGLRDLVPKIIGNFYIKWCQEKMQMELTHCLNQNQEWKQMVEEPESFVEQRKNLVFFYYFNITIKYNNYLSYDQTNGLNTLKDAIKIIKKDPDFWSYNQNVTNFDEEQSIQKIQQSQSIPETKKLVQNIQQIPNQNDSSRYNINTNNQRQNGQSIQNQQGNQVFSNQLAQPSQQQQKNTQSFSQPNQTTFNPVTPSQKSTDLFDFDNFTDKVVDKTLSNPKVQTEIKNQAGKQAYNVINNNIPITGNDGRNPLGTFAEKQTQNLMDNKKVQEGIKQGVKEGVKEGVRQQVQQPPPQQKQDDKAKKQGFLGLFG